MEFDFNFDITELAFQCCFCGEGVKIKAPDLVVVNLLFGEDMVRKDTGPNQMLYAHLKCLKEKLHKDAVDCLIVEE